MTLGERQQSLRDILQTVIVGADDVPLDGALFVVKTWEPIDLPSSGVRDFVARPWRLGDH